MTLARIAWLLATTCAVVLTVAIVVVIEDARAPADGHNPGHVGCKHGHGSSWLQSHSRRGRGSADEEDERDGTSRLRPFTAVGR